jgi:hypothetical protein
MSRGSRLPRARAGEATGALPAAPVKISPHPSAVSSTGAASVDVANPNRYALRGTAAVGVGKRTVAKRRVRLARRSVTSVKLRFGGQGIAALRAAGGRATIKLRLRRSGGRRLTARRTVTLRLASGGAPTPAPGWAAWARKARTTISS